MVMVDEALKLRIPSLFFTCIQYLNVLQLGRNFEADFASCNLQLQWIELRIQRWGRAGGITASTAGDDFLNEFGKKHDEKDVKLACDALEQIDVQFRKAQDESQRILADCDQAGLELIDEVEKVKILEPKEAHASRFVAKVKSSYDEHIRSGTKTTTKSNWAIYNRVQLQDIIKSLGDHVTTLESTIPEEGRKLVTTEVEEMDRETFAALNPVVSANDPLPANAMREDGPRKGFSWTGIQTDGDSIAQYGYNYRHVPQNEGPKRYSNIKTGGRAITHVGNTYGSENPPAMSAYMHGSRSHSVPGADDTNPSSHSR